MKRKELTQIFSVALLGSAILIGANVLPANAASDNTRSNANNASVEAVNLNDASIEIKDSEKASNSKTESEKSETTTEKKEDNTVSNGWVKTADGKWNFYSYNRKVTGLYYEAPELPLLFDENGVCQTGLVEINGKTYYFRETSEGVKFVRDEIIDGYYFKANGVREELSDTTTPDIKDGWVKCEDGKWNFYSYNHKVTGLYYEAPESPLLFDKNGVCQTGLTKIDGKTYYFRETSEGVKLVRDEIIDGCYFKANGVCEELSNTTTPNTKNGWVKGTDGKSYFYKNGKKVTGFYQNAPGCRYYLDETGVSAVGWTEINGNLYYFKAHEDGYRMAQSEVIDGHFLNSKGVCDDTVTIAAKNEEDAIKLIKENDSTYLASLENELGSLKLIDCSEPDRDNYSYFYCNNRFTEPVYKILIIQNDTSKTIGGYFVGSVTGAVYGFKENFELAYEIKNNEIVSTVHRHNPGPLVKYDYSNWR